MTKYLTSIYNIISCYSLHYEKNSLNDISYIQNDYNFMQIMFFLHYNKSQVIVIILLISIKIHFNCAKSFCETVEKSRGKMKSHKKHLIIQIDIVQNKNTRQTCSFNFEKCTKLLLALME